jgi:hypothetical protein
MAPRLDLVIPGPEELGPKMLALSERQQRFVWAMLYSPNPTAAARLAGYSDASGGCRVKGCQLMQSAAVLDALHEVGWRRLHGAALKSIAALEAVVDDPAHPKHLIAVQMVLDRSGFAAQTEHKVTVEHTLGGEKMKLMAERLAKELQVDPVRLLGVNREAVIEGEFVEVADGPT